MGVLDWQLWEDTMAASSGCWLALGGGREALVASQRREM